MPNQEALERWFGKPKKATTPDTLKQYFGEPEEFKPEPIVMPKIGVTENLGGRSKAALLNILRGPKESGPALKTGVPVPQAESLKPETVKKGLGLALDVGGLTLAGAALPAVVGPVARAAKSALTFGATDVGKQAVQAALGKKEIGGSPEAAGSMLFGAALSLGADAVGAGLRRLLPDSRARVIRELGLKKGASDAEITDALKTKAKNIVGLPKTASDQQAYEAWQQYIKRGTQTSRDELVNRLTQAKELESLKRRAVLKDVINRTKGPAGPVVARPQLPETAISTTTPEGVMKTVQDQLRVAESNIGPQTQMQRKAIIAQGNEALGKALAEPAIIPPKDLLPEQPGRGELGAPRSLAEIRDLTDEEFASELERVGKEVEVLEMADEETLTEVYEANMADPQYVARMKAKQAEYSMYATEDLYRQALKMHPEDAADRLIELNVKSDSGRTEAIAIVEAMQERGETAAVKQAFLDKAGKSADWKTIVGRTMEDLQEVGTQLPKAEMKGSQVKAELEAPAGGEMVVEKKLYTNIPKEWVGETDLYDWGQKGLRPTGNKSIGGRKMFIWQSEMEEVPVRLPKETMDAIKARTDEVWKVHNRRGEDYWIAPKQVVEEVRAQMGKEGFTQAPKPERSPKQKINDAVLSMKAHGLEDWEIGQNVIDLMPELGLTGADLNDKLFNYVKEYDNAISAGYAVPPSVSQGVGQAVPVDQLEADERAAIQAEHETTKEIGDFLDGIVEPDPAQALIDRVTADKTPQGGLTRGLDAYKPDIAALSDAELQKVLDWSRTENPYIHTRFGSEVAAELRSRGITPERPLARPVDLLGRPIAQGGTAGEQGEFLNKEDFKSPESDIEGQMLMPGIRKVPMPEIASGMMPLEPAGLTKAEQEYMSKRNADVLRRAQERGEKVGYKTGYRWAAIEGRRKLGAFQTKVLISDKSRQDAYELVRQYVPKELQSRYINRILKAKTSTSVADLSASIDKFIDEYEHRNAVKEFRDFIKDTRSKYRSGEVKFGMLEPKARDAFLSTLEQYDLSALSEEKAEELTKHLEFIQRVAGSVRDAYASIETLQEKGSQIIETPNSRIDELDRLSKQPVKDLSTEQIQRIKDELSHLVDMNSGKMASRNRVKAEHINTAKVALQNAIEVKERTARGEVPEPGWLKQNLIDRQKSLRTMLRNMLGKDAGKVEELLLDPLYFDALPEKARIKKMWDRKVSQGLKDIDFNAADLVDYYKEIEVTVGGKKYIVPKGPFLLNTWLDAHADGNLRRLLTAQGHNIDSKRGKEIRMDKMSLKELQDILRQVPDKYAKLGELMFTVNREINSPALNQAAMEIRGYPLATAENYHGFPRAHEAKARGKQTQTGTGAIETRGRYQARTGGNARHQINDPLEQWFRNIDEDATYAATAQHMEFVRSVMNSKTIQDKLRANGHGATLDKFVEMINRAQGAPTDIDVVEQMGGKILSTGGKGVLSGKISGPLVQVQSLPAFKVVIEPKYWNKVPPTPDTVKRVAQEMMDISPVFWDRWTHNKVNFVTGSVATKHAVEQMITGKTRMLDKGMTPYMWGDKAAFVPAWYAAQNKIAATTDLVRGTPEFNDAAMRLMYRAMETQPNWDVWYRTLDTSSKSLARRSLSMFSSARNAQLNVLFQLNDDYAKGRISRSQQLAGYGQIAWANMRVALAKNLWRKGLTAAALGVLGLVGYHDPEETKRLFVEEGKAAARRIPEDTAFNMLGLNVYGQIADAIVRAAVKGVEGKPSGYKQTGSMLVDAYADTQDIAGTLGRMIGHAMRGDRHVSGEDKGKPKWHTDGVKAAGQIAALTSFITGSPLAGIKTDIVWPIVRAFDKPPNKATEMREMLEELRDKNAVAKFGAKFEELPLSQQRELVAEHPEYAEQEREIAYEAAQPMIEKYESQIPPQLKKEMDKLKVPLSTIPRTVSVPGEKPPPAGVGLPSQIRQQDRFKSHDWVLSDKNWEAANKLYLRKLAARVKDLSELKGLSEEGGQQKLREWMRKAKEDAARELSNQAEANALLPTG